ncbi:MAG TPA: MGMT family protein [Acidimicrobiales bacterium]|nr:MGMT family protein [Acidimicrobiales bacterium]
MSAAPVPRPLAARVVAGAVARHRADGPEPDLARAADAVLRGLRPGDVVTYGEVAHEAGWPGRSRAVGRILATSGGAYPWWRVVNAAGRLVPGHEPEQARRLRAEGVEVVGRRVRHTGTPKPTGVGMDPPDDDPGGPGGHLRP